MELVIAVLWVLGQILGACIAYEIVLVVASLPRLWRRDNVVLAGSPTTRFLIVIPAHNEGDFVGTTVRSLKATDYPDSLRHIVVIADNCSDHTAQVAIEGGAACWERHDLQHLGKPAALHWIFNQLDLSNFDGIVIVDADTVVDRAFLRVMDARLRRGERAIQAYYGVLNPDDSWLTRLGFLPAVLNNYLTFPGKRALGLSCPLAGNGMCFDASVVKRLGWNALTLSEDWEYFLILAVHGYVVTSAPDALIYSQVASSLSLGERQRIRWTKGRLEALRLHWRSLFRAALRRRSLIPVDALVDVARPTHSILLLWSILYLILAVLIYAVRPDSGTLLVWATIVLGAHAGYLLTGWAIARPPLRAWLALVMVPWYLVWKLSVTTKALFSMHDHSWLRTTRN